MTPGECRRVLARVEALTKKHFYDEQRATAFIEEAESQREEILRSRNLLELRGNMSKLLAGLHSSHCEFVTINDEEYYFLKSLFRRHNRPKIAFTGAVTGGAGYPFDRVRSVLDASPAARSGIKCGDIIKTVDTRPYVGQLNFERKAGRQVKLSIDRGGKVIEVTLTPQRKDNYEAYLDAISASARVEKRDSASGKKPRTIGYIHFWCAGHDRFVKTVTDKLLDTDALVLDLRDGYGGNSIEDLDIFYHDPRAYPDIASQTRDGKKRIDRGSYTRPMVAIISGGTRSGKELLADSLKRSKRAKLIGEATAGAVVAGSLFKIDSRTALYLAVANVWVDDERLEGKGVEPDVSISDEQCQQGKERQLKAAIDLAAQAADAVNR